MEANDMDVTHKTSTKGQKNQSSSSKPPPITRASARNQAGQDSSSKSTIRQLIDNLKQKIELGTELQSEYPDFAVPASAEEMEEKLMTVDWRDIGHDPLLPPEVTPPFLTQSSDPQTPPMPPIPKEIIDRTKLVSDKIVAYLALMGVVPDQTALESLISHHENIINDKTIEPSINKTYVDGFLSGWINHARILERMNLSAFELKIMPVVKLLETTARTLRDSPIIDYLESENNKM